MAEQNFTLAPGLVFEDLEQEILVCDTDQALVHRISGPTADVLRRVIANDGDPITHDDDDLTRGLVDIGVIVTGNTAESGVLSRRRVIGAGAAVGTIGIATLVLPRAAAASSLGDDDDDDDDDGGGDGGFVEPARDNSPSSAITTSFNLGTGLLEVFWRPDPEPFQYSYTIIVTSGSLGTGSTFGVLSSGNTFNEIYTVAPGSSISVTFTSNTTPQASATQIFTRNA